MSAATTQLESLFANVEPADLGPLVRPGVWSVTEVNAAATSPGSRGRAGEILRALALLWHDHLDEAHAVVQDLPGADAAFVHGIMHRREPDAANARYWFHRVGPHPVFEPLADAVAPLLASHAALPHRLIRDGKWDPLAFIDAVSFAQRHPGAHDEIALLRELQLGETMQLARFLVRSS